jgi:hypothetical protein
MSMGERALAAPEVANTNTASKPSTRERHVLIKLRFKNMTDFLSLDSFT